MENDLVSVSAASASCDLSLSVSLLQNLEKKIPPNAEKADGLALVNYVQDCTYTYM